ncbi:AEBP2 [Lepeophtheirus salmonis]|uniref:AEBP2 n=1 Tax=Lepeophtheirus salmonis TaxID=72036 RepID=A0A7R8D384_LEPSM|nr:AEBP2 [Lepeophtheirus salmonis]CAF2980974.1 AEBP2 [Lepeophtheirus salmonis]
MPCYRTKFAKYGLVSSSSSKSIRSLLSDSSSTSGISDDLSSDSGSKSVKQTPQNAQNGILSETSDYQRSTPSPRDEGLYLEEVASMAFQVHDEFVDSHLQKPDLGFEDYSPLFSSWPESPNDRKTIYLHNQKLKVLPDFVYDPKIMFHRPEVLLSPIKKEEPCEEKNSICGDGDVGGLLTVKMEDSLHEIPSTPPSPPSKETQEAETDSKTQESISSSSSSSTNKFSSLPGESHNPFLPICKKSSFLFGNDEEFDEAPPILQLEDYEIEEENWNEEKLFQKSIVELQEEGMDSNSSTLSLHSTHLFTPSPKKEEDLEEEEELEGDIEEKRTIDCKWEGCKHFFISHGKLSDHLRLYHVESQFSESTFICLWDGCKVYGKKSCSQSWLEKHVPTHGGKYSFSCIVSGCKMRFSTEKFLQRHVNNHFNDRDNTSSSDQSSTMAKKILAENPSESSKNLKRAGVKLKYRRTVFSARIFDVFDIGVMSSIKASVLALEKSKRAYSVEEDWEDEGGEDVIKFTIASVKGFRKRMNSEGISMREALVMWAPENILEDEWIEATGLKDLEKVVRLRELPVESRDVLGKALFGSTESKSRRKRAKTLVVS